MEERKDESLRSSGRELHPAVQEALDLSVRRLNNNNHGRSKGARGRARISSVAAAESNNNQGESSAVELPGPPPAASSSEPGVYTRMMQSSNNNNMLSKGSTRGCVALEGGSDFLQDVQELPGAPPVALTHPGAYTRERGRFEYSSTPRPPRPSVLARSQLQAASSVTPAANGEGNDTLESGNLNQHPDFRESLVEAYLVESKRVDLVHVPSAKIVNDGSDHTDATSSTLEDSFHTDGSSRSEVTSLASRNGPCVEADQAELVREFRARVDVKNRTYRLRSYPNCFVGREAVDVLVQITGKSRVEALVVGINLGVNLFEHVCDPSRHPVLEDNYVFYRFL